MYQIGDRVLYGIHGICIITDREDRVVDRKRISYLVLEPLHQCGSRFLVPASNAIAMAKVKRLLSREELENLLYSPEVRTAAWIRDENQRKLTYRELLSCGDRVRLAAMVHAIYRHKAVQLAAGKRCHISDENFLRDAEKLLSGEIAAVMGLEPEEARAFLRQKLMGE